jgi:hypothetical protein
VKGTYWSSFHESILWKELQYLQGFVESINTLRYKYIFCPFLCEIKYAIMYSTFVGLYCVVNSFRSVQYPPATGGNFPHLFLSIFRHSDGIPKKGLYVRYLQRPNGTPLTAPLCKAWHALFFLKAWMKVELVGKVGFCRIFSSNHFGFLAGLFEWGRLGVLRARQATLSSPAMPGGCCWGSFLLVLYSVTVENGRKSVRYWFLLWQAQMWLHKNLFYF